MISGIVVACMAVFMVIGAADKALFNNRFGYGEEFERGLAAMGPLAMCLVGIMCAAPAVGRAVAPALSPLFTAIGSDPSVAAGMIFGIDSGGLTLSIALASTREAAMLSGLGLAASMGCIITYALPVSLSMCAPESRPAVAKGLAAGIAAAPVRVSSGSPRCRATASQTPLSPGFPRFSSAASWLFFSSRARTRRYAAACSLENS